MMYKKFFFKEVKLANGKIVNEPKSFRLVGYFLFFLLFIFSLYFIQFNFTSFLERGYRFWDIFIQFFPPNISYLQTIIQPLVDTIKMSFIGSLLGSLLAIPFSILASSNIISIYWLNQLVRILFTILRTLPTLVIALIATYIFGLGTFAGTIAILLFSFSYIGKQLFEQIETVDMGAFEAVQSMGASKLKVFILTIVPQVLPIYLATVLFNFEGNVRYATILGYVGAGGIGLILNDRVNNRDYASVGMILISLFLTVALIDLTSQLIRNKLT